MLNVGKIENGIVLDHIEAGKAMLIYHYLHLDREDYQVASSRTPAAMIWAAKIF